MCSVVDLSCIFLLFLAGAIYYTIIIIYICGREAAAIFFGIFGNKIVILMFGGRKKRCLHVGEKNGAFMWANKRCLHVGEKNGAFMWAKKTVPSKF